MVMICGNPGSGKSSYSNALGEFLSSRRDPSTGMITLPGYRVISFDSCKDYIAKRKDAVYNSKSHGWEARWEFQSRIMQSLAQGYGLVLDDTFKERAQRKSVYSTAKDFGLDLLLLELTCDFPESIRRIQGDSSRFKGSSVSGFCPTRDPAVVREISKQWKPINEYDYDNGKRHRYFTSVVHHVRFNTETAAFNYHYNKKSVSDQFNEFVDDVRFCLRETFERWHQSSPEDTLPVPMISEE